MFDSIYYYTNVIDGMIKTRSSYLDTVRANHYHLYKNLSYSKKAEYLNYIAKQKSITINLACRKYFGLQNNSQIIYSLKCEGYIRKDRFTIIKGDEEVC